MSIVRAKRKTNFTIIGNTGLKDKRLTLKAKGLLAYMLSLPDDWVFYETELKEHSKDGRDSIRSALKELEKSGYLVRSQKREDTGKFGQKEWSVSDEPSTENPTTVNLTTDNPTAENPPLLNTNEPSTNEPRTDSNKKSPKSKKTYGHDDFSYKAANYLLMKIRDNNPNSKEPNLQKWANSIRLMHERDNRSYEEIKSMIDWCQNHEFWSGVILSADKLRAKYDQMFAQSNMRKRKNSFNSTVESPYPELF